MLKKESWDYHELLKDSFMFDCAKIYSEDEDQEYPEDEEELIISFTGQIIIIGCIEYIESDKIAWSKKEITKKDAFKWLAKNGREFKIQSLDKLLRVIEYYGKFLQDKLISQIEEIIEKIKIQDKREGIYDHVISDFVELAKTIENKCYRSSIALSGRLLEFILKNWMRRNGIEYEEEWMVGTLLKKVGEKKLQLDKAINNIWNIINTYRVSSVHFLNDETPTEHEAKLVGHGILNIFNKVFIL